MKVAIFVHCFFPGHFYGTETYTLYLAKHLQAMGHEPTVVSAVFPGEPKNDTVVSRYEYEGIPVIVIDKNHYPNTRVKDTYYQPEIRGVLRDVLLGIRPDLVHVTHLINHTAVLLEVAAEIGIPTVATLTDFFGFCFNNRLEAADGSLCAGPNSRATNCLACFLQARGDAPDARPVERMVGRHPWSSVAATGLDILRRVPGLRTGGIAGLVLDITKRPEILRACYSHYRAVIAPTRFLHDAYARNGLKSAMHEIRFGVDLPRSPKPPRPHGATLKFGFIGQIAAHKGTDILVDAFCRLPRGRAELHVYGPSDQDSLHMSKLKANSGDHAVSFRGTFPKEQMADVLAELDFLVIPSRWYENSPLVLLNALASHTPAIVSDVAGMTEFVEEGKNGYVFSRGSTNDLERVLRAILAEPSKARDMSDTTEYARTTRTMVEDVLPVYESVML